MMERTVYDFLFQYGLFTAKVIFVVAVILLTVATFVILLGSRGREKESIEIEKMNELMRLLPSLLRS